MSREHESNRKSRCVISTKSWVHNFLDDPNNVLRVKLVGKGLASFKVVDTSWYVGLGDYILTMAEDGKNKVIYQIIEIDMTREVKVGVMEDLVTLSKLDADACKAILLMDPMAVARKKQEELEEFNAAYM